jgi:hypothetical protein
MAETIKTITDTGQFAGIFKQYFSGKDAYLRTKSGDIIVQFLGYHDGNVAFRIPRVKTLPDSILIFTRHGIITIYASLKVIENKEDTFVFLPLKLQIISEERRDDRSAVDKAENKSIIYLSNVISEGMLKNALDLNEKNVRYIKNMIQQDLKGKFDRTRIMFINESTIDMRMKHFLGTWAPIFIKDMSAGPQKKDEEGFNFFINEIYAKDYKLSSQDDIISEISVPIILKNTIPYGYIQVNSIKPINDSHLTLVKRIAMMVNEFFFKEKIFVPSDEKFIVADVSKSGLGIVFKDRRLIRFFVKDSHLVADMMLPNTHKVVLGVVVKNTTFYENGIIKVGLEISNIDAISEVNFDEFLQSVK